MRAAGLRCDHFTAACQAGSRAGSGVSQTTQDRFARLKALRRPSSPKTMCPRGKPDRKVAPDEPPGHTPDVPEGAARLGELLGALPGRNEFGEHLGLRRWFSSIVGCEPPAGPVDRAALGLLLPGAPEDVADPEQWLFL